MRLLALHSPSTKGATTRMKELIEGEGDIKVDCATKRPSNMARYDGVFLHNRADIRPGERPVLYPCGRVMMRMLGTLGDDPHYKDKVIAGKPRAIWTNSYTSEKVLREAMPLEIDIKCMQKPFKFDIPKGPPSPQVNNWVPSPYCKQKRILWYWKPNWQYTNPVNDKILAAMRALKNWEIWVISNSRTPAKPEGEGLEHLVAKGRIDFSAEAANYDGQVRATDGLDFGRGTFPLLALGKWVMYVGLNEPRCICAPTFEDIPKLVNIQPSADDELPRVARWQYIKDNFTEEAMSKRWAATTRIAFG